MRPMVKSLGGFRAALLIGWILLSAAGILYARLKEIPSLVALPVLAAFLVEYPFYLVLGFSEFRKRLTASAMPLFLAVSTLLPYLTCYVATGQAEWGSVVKLSALALALGLWYVVLPVSVLTDLAFLMVVAAVFIGRYFDAIYPMPYPRLNIAILGRLALIRITVLALLVGRRLSGTDYAFLPNGRDWRIGAVHYICFLPVGAALALPLKIIRFAPAATVWTAAGTFVGFLLVVALFEEFIFRGVLQQWMEQWTWNRTVALILTSAIFGLAHLWFRTFPNWRFALLAAVAGVFYGHARNQAGSIRAGVVTHALVVTTWRTFFS